MSPLCQRVHRLPLLPTTDRFPLHQYCLRCLSVWCRFASDDLWNAVLCFQPPSLLIGMVWVPVIHFCKCVSHTLQSTLESGHEATIVQIDFTAGFDRVNHQGILYKLCFVGIGGSVLSVLTQFLSNRSQHVIVDVYISKLVNDVSGVPQGMFWARYCSSHTARSFFPFC